MPACLGPSPWEPLSVEGEEHWAAPLLPVKRGVGVVAVLLQALLEVTVGAVDFLGEKKDRRVRRHFAGLSWGAGG